MRILMPYFWLILIMLLTTYFMSPDSFSNLAAFFGIMIFGQAGILFGIARLIELKDVTFNSALKTAVGLSITFLVQSTIMGTFGQLDKLGLLIYTVIAIPFISLMFRTTLVKASLIWIMPLMVLILMPLFLEPI